ncbi:MAG: UDP-N-acetylmuramoyl-L-alanine--D-glutamate ligase [Ruminococcaceae bacterium]|nr:UDP-N-acetylmuramoyl-L-alanine--D-glutamate ligase [Oscillospiraceae bacterium]
MCDFQGKTVSVIGLGISNTPLIGWLLDHGATVTARDKKNFEALPEAVRAYAARGVRFVCGEGYLANIEEDILFKAPGLRYDLPPLVKAVERGAVLTSEMELFFSLCPCRIIGVTGSDGKTTSTTLIYRCLAAEYGEDKVFVGGNIGKPLLPELSKMDESCFAVVELSSFQLHTMHHSPDISLITNLSPNHLDYHIDMEEYISAKTNIYRHAKPGSVVVLNGQNPVTASLGSDAPEGVTVRHFLSGEAFVRDEWIWYEDEPILKLSDILIPGWHNVENYCGILCALHGLVSKETIVSVAQSFGGVEHRIELVRVKDGVSYYNSSIDSSPTRTTAALAAFDRRVIVIVGGYDKQIPFEPLAKPLCERAKTVVLTGATAPKIKAALLSSPYYREGAPHMIEEPEFRAAVLAASQAAEKGDVVLLSPACASFDAFPNFEVRGNTFKEIVHALP